MLPRIHFNYCDHEKSSALFVAALAFDSRLLIQVCRETALIFGPTERHYSTIFGGEREQQIHFNNNEIGTGEVISVRHEMEAIPGRRQ